MDLNKKNGRPAYRSPAPDPKCEAWAELCSAAFREAFLNELKQKGYPELQGYKPTTTAKNAYAQLEPGELRHLSEYLGIGRRYDRSELLLWPENVAKETVEALDQENTTSRIRGEEAVTYPLVRALQVAELYLKAGTALQSPEVGAAFQDSASAATETVKRMDNIARNYLRWPHNAKRGELRHEKLDPAFKQKVLRDSLLAIPAVIKNSNPEYAEVLANPKQLRARCDEVLGPGSLTNAQYVK